MQKTLVFQTIFLGVLGVCYSARLENTYLPPNGAQGAGGGPGLTAPFGPQTGGAGKKTLHSIEPLTIQ